MVSALDSPPSSMDLGQIALELGKRNNEDIKQFLCLGSVVSAVFVLFLRLAPILLFSTAIVAG